MTKLTTDNRQRLHLQVRDRILNMLVKGGSKRGDAVPTYRELGERLKVSLVTVQRAMDELIKEGVVEGWPGKGTFVARELSADVRKLTQAGLVFYGSRQLFFSSPYLMEIFQGILLQAERAGADVRIFSIKSEGRIAVREIEESGVDGLLMLGVANDGYLAEVARELLPLVVLDYRTSGVPADYVVAENEKAAARLVAHLAGLGHRKIAYLDGYSTDTLLPGDPMIETSDVRERREGYRRAMEKLGLAPCVFGMAGALPPKNIEAAAARIAAGAATAVVTYDTSLARGLFEALASRGVRVPSDCSLAAVAGAGDPQIGPLTCTYNRVRFVEMGERAVKLLGERCRNGKPAEALTSTVDSDFVLGNTSAAPTA
ncbi:MAG: GntR family transcriptional regulator [Planctomycetes bacterium]|nr:GntR family transcriptional regulator [Planctomycetota bacterium]